MRDMSNSGSVSRLQNLAIVREFLEEFEIEIAENGCWIWTLSRDSAGYGITYTETEKAAYRYVYERLTNTSLKGYQLHHT